MTIKPFLDGWGDVVGSIIGGIITFIALRITIKYENKKLFEQRKLENKPIFTIIEYSKDIENSHKIGFVTAIDFVDGEISLIKEYDYINKVYLNFSGDNYPTPVHIPIKNIGNGVAIKVKCTFDKIKEKTNMSNLDFLDLDDNYFSNIEHNGFDFKIKNEKQHDKFLLFNKEFIGVNEVEVFLIEIHHPNNFNGEYVIFLDYMDIFDNTFQQKIYMGKIDGEIKISPISKIFDL